MQLSSWAYIIILAIPTALVVLWLGQKKICVYGHMSKKSRVGSSALIFFLLSAKPEIVVPGSGISFSKFQVSHH